MRYTCNPVRQAAWLTFMPWLACLAGLLAQFHLIIFSGFGQIHGGLGDGRLVNFTLEHGYRWFRQIPLHEDFWRPPIFYPYPNASAFTDTMLGFAPLYWLPRLLGAAPDTALQWWMLVVYGLNFFAAYLLLRKGARLSIPASTAGALLMGIISAAWTGHLQLSPFFYVMLALHALLRIFDEGESAARRAWIGVFFASCVLQVWGAIYAFFFFGVLSAIAVVVALARAATRRVFVQRVRCDAGTWILVFGLSTAAVVPLWSRYNMTAEETGYRNYNPRTVARPYSWIVTGPRDRLLGWLQRNEGPLPAGPLSHGIGLLTFCVATAGLIAHRRRASVQVMGIATLAMMILSTAYWGYSPWRLIYEFVPGAGGIRAQFRVTMILIPVAVLGVALACDRALRRRRYWLALLLVSVCVVERFHTQGTIDKHFLREHVASIAEQVDPESRAFFLVGTGPGAAWVAEDAAWVAMATGRPAINGRYGNFPESYEIRRYDSFDRADGETRRKLEAALGNWLDRWGISRSEVQWIEYEALSKARVRPHRTN
jgi:hypothetical protein